MMESQSLELFGNEPLKIPDKLNIDFKFILFDCESWLNAKNGITEHDCYLICAKFCKNYKDKGYFIDYNSNNSNNFKEKFGKDCIQFLGKSHNMYIIAHNIIYDFINSEIYYVLMYYKFELVCWNNKNPFFMFWRRGKQTIILQDNMNWFSGKLSSWGEVFGLPKWDDFDYNDRSQENRKRAIKYCRNDVEIIYKGIIYLCQFLKKNFEFNCIGGRDKFLTISGLTYKIFMLQYKKYISLSNYMYINLERGSYSGGRCECFKLGFIKDMCYADINSMYPYIMCNYELPYAYTENKEMTLKNLEKYACIARIFVYGIEDYNRFICIFRDDKLIFPSGNFECCVCTGELVKLIKQGVKFDLLEEVWYLKSYFLKDYIGGMYDIRVNSENESKKTLYKLFMNSLYGKFGQKSNSYEKVGDSDEIKSYFRKEEDVKLIKCIGGSEWIHEENNICKNSAVYIASHITSYARLYLFKMISKIGYENCYYCDTDSIIFDGKYKYRIDDFIDEEKLGYFKIEQEGNIEIRGLKDYTVYGRKMIEKIKGVKKGYKKVGENVYEVEQWAKLNYFIRKGEMKNYVSWKVLKKLERKYVKGVVEKDGKVRGFKID